MFNKYLILIMILVSSFGCKGILPSTNENITQRTKMIVIRQNTPSQVALIDMQENTYFWNINPNKLNGFLLNFKEIKNDK